MLQSIIFHKPSHGRLVKSSDTLETVRNSWASCGVFIGTLTWEHQISHSYSGIHAALTTQGLFHVFSFKGAVFRINQKV